MHVISPLPNGMLDKDRSRVACPPLTGVACALFCMNRLSLPSETREQPDLFEQLTYLLTQALSPLDFIKAVHIIWSKLGLEPAKDVLSRHRMYCRLEATLPSFFAADLLPRVGAQILYNQIRRHFYHQRQLEESGWSPKDGVEGIMRQLIDKGPALVVGKFGACFYRTKAKRYAAYDGEGREAYYYPKASYRHSSAWTHAVIIDDVREINGKHYLFYHDPYSASIPGKNESVYMISYDTFVKRLCTLSGFEPDKETPQAFLLQSSNHELLANPEAISESPVAMMI